MRERIRSLPIWKPIFLLFLASVGAFFAYGLVVHLAKGTSLLVDPDRIGRVLLADVCHLVWAAALLIAIIVLALARQQPGAASFGRRNALFVSGMVAGLLGAVLIDACPLIAAQSFAVAWHVETAALILGVAGPALMLVAAWRREAWWHGKQADRINPPTT